MKTAITREDILDLATYEAIRMEKRAHILELKKNRRVALGPDATLYFESYDTMWWQVHEMLRIEQGGEAQIADELAAYNPLIPQGNELVTTMMIEIEDPARRARVLANVGHIEEHLRLRFGPHTIAGIAEADLDRTNAAGKASSVQFIHFPFTAAQITAFCEPGTDIIMECTHPNYFHKTLLSQAVHQELQNDFLRS